MLLPALIALSALTPPTLDGTWTGVLDSPGGPLRFGVELGGDLQAVVVNGPERIEVPTASFEGGSLLLRFDHYDSEIRATLGEEGTFAGEWTKVGARGKLTTMPFEMTRPARRGSFSLERADWHRERHAVDFESSDDSAVLLLETEPRPAPGEPARALATFMTTTGDYRYLAGTLDDARLTLSVFDGAHAFLFIAERDDAGGFSGDFWSRDTWHETWTSRPDPDAALPDAFAETTWTGDASLDELVFRDLEGAPVSVASLRAPGQPMVLKVFGSWCPNCHDAGRYMSALAKRFPEVAFVGLAFEHTEDHARSARQVRAYAERHDIDFPLLVAGLSDKAEASRTLPVLDRVRSFPTTIFIDRAGRVRAIHTGFTGPATGQAWLDLQSEFERLIEDISRP